MDHYDRIQEAEHRCFSLDDVVVCYANSAQSLKATLDNCALELAKGYVAGHVSFNASDKLVLFAYAADHDSIPDFMFSIYLAFDAGEFFPISFVRNRLKNASLHLKLMKFSKDMPPSNIPVEARLRRRDAPPANRWSPHDSQR
jgi:hypothetical protein